MGLDGGLTDEEVPPDLGVRAPGGDQTEDLGLSLCVRKGTTRDTMSPPSTSLAWTDGSRTA
jgi:hypothetical protein